jgi:hypothetical protein
LSGGGSLQPQTDSDNSKNIATAAAETIQEVQEEIKEEEEWKPNDDMTELAWFGPEDSDEEIEEMAKHKTQWEIDQGVKFSKKGLIGYIEKMIAYESNQNKEDPVNAKLWEQKLKQPGLTYCIKKGGTKESPS